MTNTLKHLALLARMESSGLKLGLTGKFPEDALDQTCERVESFQLQNRLRTGNDNAQIQKELVRTPEFAARNLYGRRNLRRSTMRCAMMGWMTGRSQVCSSRL